MDERDMYPKSSRSLEGLREMRLQALLRDMIDAEGGSRAAALGVRYRTLSRAVEEPGGGMWCHTRVQGKASVPKREVGAIPFVKQRGMSVVGAGVRAL